MGSSFHKLVLVLYKLDQGNELLCVVFNNSYYLVKLKHEVKKLDTIYGKGSYGQHLPVQSQKLKHQPNAGNMFIVYMSLTSFWCLYC